MPQRGDVVLLSWQQKSYNALVTFVNTTNESHLGANGEPALHLAVLLDEPLVNGKPKPLPIGEFPQVTYLYDVVHESHVFDDEFNTLHGADAHKHRGAGEWCAAWVAADVPINAPALSESSSSGSATFTQGAAGSIVLAQISGGTGPYSVAVDAASPNQLPDGLTASIDAAGQLTVSGTPTVAGSGSVLLDITDSTGASVAKVGL